MSDLLKVLIMERNQPVPPPPAFGDTPARCAARRAELAAALNDHQKAAA
jgi:hypothetical protein